MATMGWPCWMVELSPRGSGCKSLLATRRRARSQCESVAVTSTTSCLRPSAVSTSSCRASPMTCRFVAMRPSALTTKPVPRPSNPSRPTWEIFTTEGFTSAAISSTDLAASATAENVRKRRAFRRMADNMRQNTPGRSNFLPGIMGAVYSWRRTKTPILLPTTTSILPSLLTSPGVTWVPTPLASSMRWGMNCAPPLPSRLIWNQ